MDETTFDALTRSVVTDAGTRRTLVRLLVGTALGAVVSRLGAGEEIEAKATKHHGPSQRQQPRHASPERQSQQHPHPKTASTVQSEGNGKGKGKGKGTGKGKGHHKPPPLPPGCENCNECQMCKRGTCVPDPALARVRCQGSGVACGYCQDGACTGSDAQPCADGVCPKKGQCCPEEGTKQCPDPETSRGFYCVDKNACCPDTERKCASGSCLPRAACCPEQKRCNASLCVGENECCPGETPCDGGGCVAQGECCPGNKLCSDGSCVGQHECCSEEKPCWGGCIAQDVCCPGDTPPECNKCDSVVCDHGEYVCQSNHECPAGGEWNPDHCRCEFCEEVCDPGSHMCQSPQCQDNERCVDGICTMPCLADARFPQTCCAKDPWTQQVLCYCTAADEICFWCNNGVCACTPGDPQFCCDPKIHGPNCPAACQCPARS